MCLGCAECNSAIHQFVINARVSECSPSIIIAGVAGVVSHYVPTLTWLVRALTHTLSIHIILYPSERGENSSTTIMVMRCEMKIRAHCISYYCVRAPLIPHSQCTYARTRCRICALIYTQANKSCMNFFLITRDIKERARLERSLNYYRSTAAFASRCAAGNPLQQSTFQTRESRSMPAMHTAADVKMLHIEKKSYKRE